MRVSLVNRLPEGTFPKAAIPGRCVERNNVAGNLGGLRKRPAAPRRRRWQSLMTSLEPLFNVSDKQHACLIILHCLLGQFSVFL